MVATKWMKMVVIKVRGGKVVRMAVDEMEMMRAGLLVRAAPAN